MAKTKAEKAAIKSAQAEAAGDKKAGLVKVTMVRGCTFTDGEKKFVSGKPYKVTPKEADKLVASGAFKKLG